MAERFDDWILHRKVELAAIDDLLRVPLSDEPEPLWRQVRDIEAHYGRAQFILAQADAYLDMAESEAVKALQSAPVKMTAYEKQLGVDAAVAPVRESRDAVRGRVEAIKQRVMLGQSRMAYLRDLGAFNAERRG